VKGAKAASLTQRNGKGIEEIVWRLDNLLQAVDEVPAPDLGPSGLEPDLVVAARRMLKEEQERGQLFGPDMFPNPGWAIVLHLFVCAAEGRSVSLEGACAAAGVPEDVALRHIAVLVAAKLVRRQARHGYADTIYLTLTPAGETCLRGFFNRDPRDKDAAAA
jgi:hypothetical protein